MILWFYWMIFPCWSDSKVFFSVLTQFSPSSENQAMIWVETSLYKQCCDYCFFPNPVRTKMVWSISLLQQRDSRSTDGSGGRLAAEGDKEQEYLGVWGQKPSGSKEEEGLTGISPSQAAGASKRIRTSTKIHQGCDAGPWVGSSLKQDQADTGLLISELGQGQ